MAWRRNEVAITGMGVITPGGDTLDDFWASLCAGKSLAATITHFDDVDSVPVRFACEVHDFSPKALLGAKEARRMDRFSQFGVSAAVKAYIDAGEPPVAAERAAVIAGTGIGGLRINEIEMTKHIEGTGAANPLLVPMMMPNAAAGLIAMRLGWKGPNL